MEGDAPPRRYPAWSRDWTRFHLWVIASRRPLSTQSDAPLPDGDFPQSRRMSDLRPRRPAHISNQKPTNPAALSAEPRAGRRTFCIFASPLLFALNGCHIRSPPDQSTSLSHVQSVHIGGSRCEGVRENDRPTNIRTQPSAGLASTILAMPAYLQRFRSARVSAFCFAKLKRVP